MKTPDETSPELNCALTLARTHDWFFEYSDDHGVWRRGWDERMALVQLTAALPEFDQGLVVALAPPECRADFEQQIANRITRVAAAVAVAKSTGEEK